MSYWIRYLFFSWALVALLLRVVDLTDLCYYGMIPASGSLSDPLSDPYIPTFNNMGLFFSYYFASCRILTNFSKILFGFYSLCFDCWI